MVVQESYFIIGGAVMAARVWTAHGGPDRAAHRIRTIAGCTRLATDIAVQRVVGSAAQENARKIAYRKRLAEALGDVEVVDPPPLPPRLALPMPEAIERAPEPLALPPAHRPLIPIVPIYMLGGR